MKDNIQITGTLNEQYNEILTEDAMNFISKLQINFNQKRKDLLSKRLIKQEEISSGKMPDFPEETKSVRESEWKVAAIPEDLIDRRVEITGPVDRKMIINALNLSLIHI